MVVSPWESGFKLNGPTKNINAKGKRECIDGAKCKALFVTRLAQELMECYFKYISCKKVVNVYNAEELRQLPNVSFLNPPLDGWLEDIETNIGQSLPIEIKQWITDFGSFQISVALDYLPNIIFLGTSPDISIWDDILEFNYPNNPSNPLDYLVFAYEYDGRSDNYYGLDQAGKVLANKNWFAKRHFTNRSAFTGANWVWVSDNIQEFMDQKVSLFTSTPEEYERRSSLGV
ncbi:MAG: hypothetical protein U0176_10150 [Bacteroidia bacterium]